MASKLSNRSSSKQAGRQLIAQPKTSILHPNAGTKSTYRFCLDVVIRYRITIKIMEKSTINEPLYGIIRCGNSFSGPTAGLFTLMNKS